MHHEFLTNEQIEHFLARGYVVIHDCFTPEAAKRWTNRAWQRIGYDPDDASTWGEERIDLAGLEIVEVKEYSPKAWGAACELLGGEDRVCQPYCWSDGFIVNLGSSTGQPWQPPSPDVRGWHKDGDFFLHFLDSPEQALLTIVLFSDMKSHGGGTFIGCDSVPVIARYMAAHPEGVLPEVFESKEFISQCHDFVELTGEVGDVVLLHPYMLHAFSRNEIRSPRFIINPPIALKEPMNFNRDNPEEYSPVERAVLNGLGVERLDFRPTSPRRRVLEAGVIKRQRLEKEQAIRAAQKHKTQHCVIPA